MMSEIMAEFHRRLLDDFSSSMKGYEENLKEMRESEDHREWVSERRRLRGLLEEGDFEARDWVLLHDELLFDMLRLVYRNEAYSLDIVELHATVTLLAETIHSELSDLRYRLEDLQKQPNTGQDIIYRQTQKIDDKVNRILVKLGIPLN